MIDSIIAILLPLVIIGVLTWAVLKYIPMEDPIPKMIKAVVVIITILWLLTILISKIGALQHAIH